MNAQSQYFTLYLYAGAALAVLATGFFVWRNMQPKYQHHRFFGKEAFGFFTAANALLVGPVIARSMEVGTQYPTALAAVQVAGAAIYFGCAFINIRQTGWIMGLAGTLFQTLLFGSLFVVVLAWVGVRFGFGSLRVFGSLMGAQVDTYRDYVNHDEAVYDLAQRDRDIQYGMRTS